MTVPLVPPSGLNALVAPVVSTDASLALAAAATLPDALQSVDTCIVQLAAALTRVTSFANEDSNSSARILTNLEKPFDNLGTAVADLLLPDPEAVDDQSIEGFVKSVGSQIADAINNPILSAIDTQSAVFNSSVDQIRKILFSSSVSQPGLVVDYFNRAQSALKSLFLGDNASGNFAGVFMYAIQYGIPAVDTELFYLKRLKTSITSLNEGVSTLPANISFTIPNNGVIDRLCRAESLLKTNAARLRLESVFDRGTFGDATNLVCGAKELIFSGKFDQDLLARFTKDFLGIADFKAKDLANIVFLPDLSFKLNLQLLQTTAQLFASQEAVVTELYVNMANAVESIKSLADMQLGDVLGVLVDVLRRQISAVRLELQVFSPPVTSSGVFQQTAQSIANGDPTQIKARTNSKFAGFDPYTKPQVAPPPDITTYLSSQLSAYLVLVNLCTLMQRIPHLYTVIGDILNFESLAFRTILDLVARFNVEDCGNPLSGQKVIAAVDNYLKAANQRMRNTQHCGALTRASDDLMDAILEREDFLVCMKSHLFFGLDSIGTVISTVADGAALLTSIKTIAGQYPEIAKEMRSLNFKNLLGFQQEEYSALEVLLKSVQCLLLNCDNPMLQSVGRDLNIAVNTQLGNRKSTAFTMASLDDIPQVAARARGNQRTLQILQSLAAIRSLLNLDLSKLCVVSTPDQQLSANINRTNSAGVRVGNAPIGSVAPTAVAGGNTGVTPAVSALGDALLVQSQLFPAAPSSPAIGAPLAGPSLGSSQGFA